jgi:hypothetical protein
MPEQIRIKIPDDVPTEDVVKALESTAQRLREEQQAKPLSGFEDRNPAAKHMVEFVGRSYSIMVDSMVKEIGKVLE